MAEVYNVFISWSGERSKRAAVALREWLPTVLQAIKPWMSDTDIDKGSRGLDEVARALDGMKAGIICLTPENLKEEWILYEAGALSKTLDPKTRLWTYLLAGLRTQDIKPPLGMFQATRANDEEDTRKLMLSINKYLDTVVSDKVVDTVFDKMWPDLEAKLAALPNLPEVPPPTRSVGEMLAEVLELSRAMTPAIQSIARETEGTRVSRELEARLFEHFAESRAKAQADLEALHEKLRDNAFTIKLRAAKSPPTTARQSLPSPKKK